MHLLLDSHIMLWIVAPGSRQLSARAKRIVTEAASVQFSLVSLWELAIKAAKGQLDIDLDRLLSALDEAGLQELPLRRQAYSDLANAASSSPRSIRSDAGRPGGRRAAASPHLRRKVETLQRSGHIGIGTPFLMLDRFGGSRDAGSDILVRRMARPACRCARAGDEGLSFHRALPA